MRRDSRTVGVLAFDVGNPYFTEITSAIFAVASETGRLVTIGNIGVTHKAELDYIALLRSQRVGALILAASGRVDPEHNERVRTQLNAFRAGGGRVALIGRHEVEGDSVRPDNVGGGEAAAKALLELGHTTVGVLTGSVDMTVVLDRLSGFADVYAAAGHPIAPERIVEGFFLIERGYEAMAQLLEQAPEITAVFCLNDGMALGALRLLRERGIEVPGQISVMGFEDVIMAREVWPPLSTVHVPLAEMGETAMKMLLEDPAPTPQTVRLPTRLCLRATTAPPAGR
jgi:LacI family transcriptional regulator